VSYYDRVGDEIISETDANRLVTSECQHLKIKPLQKTFLSLQHTGRPHSTGQSRNMVSRKRVGVWSLRIWLIWLDRFMKSCMGREVRVESCRLGEVV
jgi:hypothetical protein